MLKCLRKTIYLAHTNLGVALAEKGELDQAVFHYQTALQIQPDDG